MSQRLKILMSAYACRPGEGSEPSIGWETARAIAQEHDVWVLTRANNRPSLEAELNMRPIPGLEIVDFDIPRWARWWKHGQWGVYLHYYLWQIWAYFRAKKLHQQLGFDIVHHVTYVKYWSPSFLALLPIPFVWGPVGGGENCPTAFRSTFSQSGQVYEQARYIMRWLGERDPFVAMTARRSAIARATTQDTAQRLYQLGAKQVQVYSQVGMAPEQMMELAALAANHSQTIRFVSVGRLLHWKGFHLGLQAFAQAQPQLPKDAEYWIVGDGVERHRLQDLATNLGIKHQVHFKGQFSRQDILNCLGNCLALVHPSLHESGGMVCTEAMAAGCPVICLDLGGPAVQVTEDTGIKVSAQTPEQTVQELTEAMVTIAKDPLLRSRLGQVGQQRVRTHYCWDAKGKELANLYTMLHQQVKNSFPLVSRRPAQL